MIQQIAYSFFATVGFAYIFNAPKKSIFLTGLIGSAGWMVYAYFHHTYTANILGSFAGALVVAILSELAARQYKMPATVFLTSGIIPLVPGGGMYFTMLELIRRDFDSAMSKGTETIFIAGSIAIAIALGSSLFRVKRRKENQGN